MTLLTKIKAKVERFRRHPLDTKTNLSNFVLAVMLGVYTVKSSCGDDKMKEHMKALATKQVSLDSTLVELQKQQLKTDLKIDRFDVLLGKESELVDREVATNGKLDTLLDVLIGNFNMDADNSNRSAVAQLQGRMDAYNKLALTMNDLNKQTQVFREVRDKYKYIRLQDGKARLSLINLIYNKFEVLKDVGILIPGRKLEFMLDSLLNSVYVYKDICEDNLAKGVEVDTSFLGNKMFIDIMYYSIDFSDSVAKYFEEARGSARRNLSRIEEAIELNSKKPNKRERKRS